VKILGRNCKLRRHNGEFLGSILAIRGDVKRAVAARTLKLPTLVDRDGVVLSSDETRLVEGQGAHVPRRRDFDV